VVPLNLARSLGTAVSLPQQDWEQNPDPPPPDRNLNLDYFEQVKRIWWQRFCLIVRTKMMQLNPIYSFYIF